MTLVLAAHGRNTVWVVADRCIFFGPGRKSQRGVKVMTLDTHDGTGIVAYAGLGTTGLTQPSEWMPKVLRGRGDLGFEESLQELAAAAERQFPPHLARLPSQDHCFVAVGFIHGVGAVTYTIDNLAGAFELRRWANQIGTNRLPPVIVLAGSGGAYLGSCSDQWRRPLLSLLKAHDKGKVSDLCVADRLAELNHHAYLAGCERNRRENAVGPRSIVVWKRRPGTVGVTGGEHRFYTKLHRNEDCPSLPAISVGNDMQILVDQLHAGLERAVLRNAADPSQEPVLDLNVEGLMRALKGLPTSPDERLR